MCPGPGVRTKGSRCAEEALRTRTGGDADDGGMRARVGALCMRACVCAQAVQ